MKCDECGCIMSVNEHYGCSAYVAYCCTNPECSQRGRPVYVHNMQVMSKKLKTMTGTS